MEVNPRDISYSILPFDHIVNLDYLEQDTEQAFILQFADGELYVCPDNAEMYVYKQEIYGTTYDHLRVTDEGSAPHLIKMTEELSDRLFEAEFPYRWRKRPEPEVYRELGLLALGNLT